MAWISIHNDTAPSAVATVSMTGVLVAEKPLCPGAFLRAEDIGSRMMAAAAAGPDAALDTAETRQAMLGAAMRRCVAPGAPVHAGDVVRFGERDFLASVLAPGTRAISVVVESLNGTAGLLWAGDHVDLILTQTTSDSAVPVGRRAAAETVAWDVRVIGIEMPPARGPAPAGSPPAPPQAPVVQQGVDPRARTVSLEVTPLQAERISVAARIGRISLSIHPDLGLPAAAAPAFTTTWASDVSQALGSPPPVQPQQPPRTLRVFQGVADAKEFRF